MALISSFYLLFVVLPGLHLQYVASQLLNFTVGLGELFFVFLYFDRLTDRIEGLDAPQPKLIIFPRPFELLL